MFTSAVGKQAGTLSVMKMTVHDQTNISSRTFWPPGVELLHGVIQADADRGEAHLSVQSCHQSTVQTARALSLHHGDDGAKHTSVPRPLDIQWGFGFTLNLKEQNVFMTM